jgi:hypothetical protein
MGYQEHAVYWFFSAVARYRFKIQQGLVIPVPKPNRRSA